MQSLCVAAYFYAVSVSLLNSIKRNLPKRMVGYLGLPEVPYFLKRSCSLFPVVGFFLHKKCPAIICQRHGNQRTVHRQTNLRSVNSRTGQFFGLVSSPKYVGNFGINSCSKMWCIKILRRRGDHSQCLQIIQFVSFLVWELTSLRLDWPRVGLSANCPLSGIASDVLWQQFCVFWWLV